MKVLTLTTSILGILTGLVISMDGAAEAKETVFLSEPEPIVINITHEPSEKTQPNQYEGKVSYYTEKGCLGCNEELITASGDILDDSKLTLAIPAEWRSEIPMGTIVRVENTSEDLSVMAKVNDTGGFLKYDRIADLSLATCQAIKCKTDVNNIKITVME